MSSTYSEYVFVDLNIQHVVHMRPIILSSEVCPAVQYFSMLSHKGAYFRKKNVNVRTMRVLILYTSFYETFLRRIERDMIKSVY